MSTTTMLGTLRTEVQRLEDSEGAGSRTITMHRPAGTPLRNDGIWHYWLAFGYTYRLAFDGTGWHVTCDMWKSGHIYRLAEAQDLRFVDRLPLDNGDLVLDRAAVYELRERETGTWVVYSI